MPPHGKGVSSPLRYTRFVTTPRSSRWRLFGVVFLALLIALPAIPVVPILQIETPPNTSPTVLGHPPQTAVASHGPRPGPAAPIPLAKPSSVAPYVADTLVLTNNTNVPGNFLAVNGISPIGLAIDSGKSELFIANSWSNSVSILSDASHHVVGSVSVGSQPAAVVYDSGKGEVFVVNSNGSSVSVVSDSTNRVVATIPIGTLPNSAAYDPRKGEVFVTNTGTDNVSVISDVTNKVVTTIGDTPAPAGIAYDSTEREMFAVDGNTSSLSVISDSTNQIVAHVGVGSTPALIAYDSAKGEMFVTNNYGSSVSVVSDSSNSQVASVPVGDSPYGVAIDPTRGEVFVDSINPYSGLMQLQGISDASNSVVSSLVVPSGSTSVVYDNGTGEILVLCTYLDSLSVVSDVSNEITATIRLGSNPVDLASDSGVGQVFVSDGSWVNLSAISEATDRIVAQIPLGTESRYMAYDPARQQVFVATSDANNVTVVSDSTDRVVALVSLQNPEYLTYDSAVGRVFVTNLYQGTGNYFGQLSAISDSTDTVTASVPSVSFLLGVACDPATGEVFVAEVDSNSVGVFSDTTGSLVANVSIGGSPGALAYDAARGEMFVTDSTNNDVSVISAATNQVVRSISVGESPAGIAYDPVTGEIFVANGRSDNVSVISDATDNVIADIPVGSSPMGIAIDDATGNAFVANWGQGTVSILSTGPREYPVTFTESGLPSGTEWGVSVDRGSTISSTNSTLSVTEPNGTYAYTVSTIDTSYSAPSGSFSVYGGPTSEAVAFTQVVYAVTFAESGLPTGTEWWVNVTGGPSTSSTSTVLSFGESNGTHAYVVATTNKTYASPGGVFFTAGATVSETATFSRVTNSVTFVESGLPSGTQWWVSVDGGPAISSTTGSLSVRESNGTYPFAVLPISGYNASPSGGSVVVAGQAVSVSIGFSSASSATFLGLPQMEGYGVLGGLIAVIVVAVGVMILFRKRRAKSPPVLADAPSTPEAGRHPGTP